jgi:hypothetical protein
LIISSFIDIHPSPDNWNDGRQGGEILLCGPLPIKGTSSVVWFVGISKVPQVRIGPNISFTHPTPTFSAVATLHFIATVATIKFRPTVASDNESVGFVFFRTSSGVATTGMTFGRT